MLQTRLERWATARRSAAILGVVVLVALLSAGLRAGQSAPAPLTGTIYDAMGAVIPGVSVTLVDAGQTRKSVKSVATGRFEFAAVAPGKYVIEARLPGFRTLRNEFELRTARDWDRAVTLQIGDLQESVSVRGTRPAVTAAQAASRTAAPVRVGGSVRVPRKLTDVRPVYPVTMQNAGMTGTVPLEAVIGRDGSIATVRVLSAQVHPDLATAAIDAVRQWRFSPTLLNGVPVEVMMTVTVNFDLGG